MAVGGVGNKPIVPGSYNDPKRKPAGLFEKEQLEYLDSIKDDPETKRLVDNQAMGKDQFMHILLTQLANQNPLNPMEDKDFIGQMAQFSSLEGMQKLNDNFEKLTGDIKNIKEIIGSSNSSDVALLKISKIIDKIAGHLGINIEEGKKDEKTQEGEKIKNTDKLDKTEKVNETDQLNTNQDGKKADDTDTVNKETNKKNGEKAYDI